MLVEYIYSDSSLDSKKKCDAIRKKAQVLASLDKRNKLRKKNAEVRNTEKLKKSEEIDIFETTKKFLGEDVISVAPLTMSFRELSNSTMLTNSTTFSTKSGFVETKEEFQKRTELALISWINQLCGVDKECCNDMESFTEKARMKADNILKTSLLNQKMPMEPICKFKNSPIGLAKKASHWANTLLKAKESLEGCAFMNQIKDMVERADQICSSNVVPFSDIGLKNDTLKTLFNYNSTWLRLAIECIFDVELITPGNGSLKKTITSFLTKNLFSDPQILKSKTLCPGGKNFLTPLGIKYIQNHFITKFLQIVSVIEYFQTIELVIPRNPPMFEAQSMFRTSMDVVMWLRKAIISTKFNLKKALEKVDLSFCYEQKFIDTYVFIVKDLSTDLCDGIILAKVVEIVLKITDGSLISSLRQPRGDRIKKLGNVNDVLKFARDHDLDIGKIQAKDIVHGNLPRIIEMLWKIVGVFEAQKDEYVILRRFSNKIEKLSTHLDNPCRSIPNFLNGFEIVIHLCKQFALLKNLEVPRNIDDLTDGCLLYNVYDYFCSKYEGIPSSKFNGTTLLKKVFSIGQTRLGIPYDLANYTTISLRKYDSFKHFVKLYLEKCFIIMEYHESAYIITRVIRKIGLIKSSAALKIQSWYRGTIVRRKFAREIIERRDKINKMKQKMIEDDILDAHDLNIPLVSRFSNMCEVLTSMRTNDLKRILLQLDHFLHLSNHLGLYFVNSGGYKFLCFTIRSLNGLNSEKEIYLLFKMKKDSNFIAETLLYNMFNCFDSVNVFVDHGNNLLLLWDKEKPRDPHKIFRKYVRNIVKKMPILLPNEICHKECSDEKIAPGDCKINRMISRLHSYLC
uniref:Calponin-homology (CH) domain-containing protein n=1 Tax=Strongyloides stercoralis TaxID=6248 RepID=A0A0K0E918_STRER